MYLPRYEPYQEPVPELAKRSESQVWGNREDRKLTASNMISGKGILTCPETLTS